MLHRTPALTPKTVDLLGKLDRLNEALAAAELLPASAERLRRMARGAVAASSVGLDGHAVPAPVAAAILTGDRRPASYEQDVVAAYGRAMDHVAALADDPRFKWNHRVVADLHFDLAWPEPSNRPGRLRTGPAEITEGDGKVVYTAPSADDAAALTAELVAWLRKGDLDVPAPARAAMAHLHLASIHPFADGNGRASRVLQSLVLALGGGLAPELVSIDEHLAADSAAYFAALGEARGSTYDPDRNAAGWVEFCLRAHVAAAKQRLELIDAGARRWAALEAIAVERGWPDRLVVALEQALTAGLDRASYTAEAGVSDATGSADLRRLVDAGFLTVLGAGRTTSYEPTDELRRHG